MRAILLKNKKVLSSLFVAVAVVGGIAFLATQQKKDTKAPQESSAIGGIIQALSNNNPGFSKYANTPSDALNIGALTVPGGRENGFDAGQGKFRTLCLWSHFAYDDPVVYPGEPGKSHLHMFFGNTGTNANTTRNSLINSGGGSCQGAELNRTAYWVPALQDGKGNVKVPYEIVIYYKSKGQSQISPMPQGLVMIAGEFFGMGSHQWSCGGSGNAYNFSATIPQCGSDFLHGDITFPQCWDGKNLDSGNHKDHMAAISEDGGQRCPASHPVRFPQVQVLLYWKNPGDTTGWYVSSDRHNGANHAPGSTLHSDWWGGWNNQIMNAWTNNCVRASKDCSIGQLGSGSGFDLPRFTGSNLVNNLSFDGQNTLPLPAGSETAPTPPPTNPNPNPGTTPPTPTPSSPQATPGAQTLSQNPTAIAINADTFTQYNDGAGNLGTGACRADAPNADLKPSDGHCTIGWFDLGDWYEYTIKAPSAGRYALVVSYGNGETGSTGMRVSVNGSEQINKTNLSPTGGWEVHQPTVIGELTLNAGDNKVRFDQSGYMDIDNMTFTLQGSSTPPTPTPTTPTPTTPVPAPSAAPAVTCNNPVSVSAPGSDLASRVSGAANGTCFKLANGTYNFGDVRPKDGMTFLGDSKVGVIIDGNGKENAFSGNSRNVTISNMTFRNFNNAAGQTAQEQAPIRGTTGIWQTGAGNLATGWLIDNVVAHNNVASGVFVGNEFTVRNSTFYNNGVTGIGGTRFSGGLFQGNTIYDNGRNQATGAGQNGGNIKVTFVNGTSKQLVIKGNTLTGSTIGIWCDINCDGVLIEGNTVSNTETSAIFSEISRNITIRGNTINNGSSWVNWGGDWNNGAIGVGESGKILIEGNTINGGKSAVTVRQTKRPAAGEDFLLSQSLVNVTSNNVTVRGNKINGSGSIGAAHGPTGAGLLDYNTIKFVGNTYSNSGAMQFWWNNQQYNYTNWLTTPGGSQDDDPVTITPTPTPPTPTPTPPAPTPPTPPTDPHSGHSGSTDPKAITIRARGAQGDETMELWINGQQQMVFNNVAKTDADYTHVLSASTTIDTIEVKFTNDNSIEGALDRMLTVDGITINGTKYETEASTTKSSGIWDASTACAEGYKQSETMACNGWVRYEAAKGVVVGGSSPTAPGCTAANPLTMSFKPDAAGKYTVWARINVRNNVAKPTLDFNVSEKCVSVNVSSAVNTWTWVKLGSDIDLQNVTQNVKAYAFSDSDIWVDKVLFTFDKACSPAGDDAQGCVVDRIEATILGLTQGQTIAKGTPLNIFAEVLGIKGSATTITFSIDGNKISENIKTDDTTYCLMMPVNNECGSFSTSGLSAGSHTLSLSASDSGRVVTVARTFMVTDAGTNPSPTPTPPSPTPPSPSPTPPSPTPNPPTSGTTVSFEAETFSSYNDNSPGNFGTGTCKASEAPNADMKPTGSGGCTIGWIDPGDWYEWTVNVPTAGNYTLTAKYANGETANTSVKFSANDVLQVVNSALPPTGSWETLKDGTMGVLTLKAGENKIRFDQTGWIDFDVFTLIPGGTPTAPSTNASTVSIKARGFTGEENIALKINGQTVASWNKISIAMTDYTYSAKTPTIIDSIRVEYTNDENSVPKNVQIDNITIDGTTYESEATQTYSVGSWNPATGCDAGFKANEYISCPGFLEYQAAKGVKLAMGTNGGGSTPGGSNGSVKSTVKIVARGTSGAEKMLLKINGNTVATFANLSTSFSDYSYTATQTATIDTLRVHFNEDGYFNSVDKNIIIDYVEIDGVKYQTEAKSVYSKGVWTRSTGCRLGFKKHDWLSCNGWVEYRDAKGVVLAKSVLADTTEEPSGSVKDTSDKMVTTVGGSTISLREGSTVSQLLLKGRDDNEMPTVEFGNLQNADDTQKVEGDVQFSIERSSLEQLSTDNKGLIQYTIDGQSVGIASFESPQLQFDTRRIDNGQHKLIGVAMTLNNEPIRDFAITIEVENEINPVSEAKDQGAPLLVLGSNSLPKVDIRGKVILTATPEVMSEGNGRLVFTVDGEAVGTTPVDRPEFVIDTADLSNGPHVFGVTVFGREGQLRGHEMQVVVDNSFFNSLQVWSSNKAFRLVVALGLLVGALYLARPQLRSAFVKRLTVVSGQAENSALLKNRSLAFVRVPAAGIVPAAVLFFGSILAFALPGVAEFSGTSGFLIEAESAIGATSNFTTGLDGARTYVMLPKTGSTPTPPTPTPTPPTPGTGSPIKTEAELFTDYSDGTAGNLGTGTCRTSDAPNADTKPTGSGGCTLGWLDPGDWYEWTVTAPSAGSYTLNLTYANGEAGVTSARFSVDGTQQINATTINPTGSWDTLSSADVGVLTLKAGANKIRFDQTGYIDLDYFTLTAGGTPTPTPTPTPPSPSPNPPATSGNYQQSLALIKNFPYRNTKEDNSPYLNTPSAQLFDKSDLYGTPADYMTGRGSYNGAEWIEGEYFAGSGAAGTFRISCEVSHFSYDDPVVYPGQPGAAHLHMFMGNTHTNAYSTYQTMIDSGGGTCNGGELNRTGYWMPAVLDGQGSVVVPSKVKFYYKTEFPAGIGKVVTYPDNLQIVADSSNNVNSNLDLATWRCNTMYNGGKHSGSATIPNCSGAGANGEPGALEYLIFFDYCWNGNTSTIGNWQANAGNGSNGNLVPPLRFWHSSECPASHPKLFPALVTHIFFDVKPGENTSQWYLSSDVNPATGVLDKPRGSTAHADWFGAWNKQVNQEFVNNCSNRQGAECGGGILGDPRLMSNPRSMRLRHDWITGYNSPNSRIPVKAIFDGMCQYDKALNPANGYSQGAYCRP